jgi:hypothetical protein
MILSVKRLSHNRHYPNTLHSPCRYSSDPRKRESVVHAGGISLRWSFRSKAPNGAQYCLVWVQAHTNVIRKESS